jgi:hypothetical protein
VTGNLEVVNQTKNNKHTDLCTQEMVCYCNSILGAIVIAW